MPSFQTECLIIGSGIAGLSAAIALAEKGSDVTVITTAPTISDCNTAKAQGGIIYQSGSHDPEKLRDDILRAGNGSNYPAAVDQLIKLGPKCIEEILFKKAKVAFKRHLDGKLEFTREAAHQEERILYVGDETGKSIEEALVDSCKTFKNIHFLSATTAVNLLMTSFHSKESFIRHEPSRCFGAFVFNQTNQNVYPIFASHTILATGGIGQLYLYNTNSNYSRGDGIALAYRSGCRLSQLEFVQFHPTTFFHPDASRFLISEALRGEGGLLYNQKGDRFLKKFLPDYDVPELGPRSKVAWAINKELLATGTSCVYLDISHKPADWIRNRFPSAYNSCLQFDIDITKSPIPVVPAAHYHIGGVWTDLDGRTSIPNLWAVGEVACTGLHGSNRLASTSLLEGLVWGTRAGEKISFELSEKSNVSSFPEIDEWKTETLHVDVSFLKQDWLMLKHTMWNYVGLVKTQGRLDRADGILRELIRGIDVFYKKAILSDTLIGLRHASLVAWLIVQACKRNTVSEGCHQMDESEL